MTYKWVKVPDPSLLSEAVGYIDAMNSAHAASFYPLTGVCQKCGTLMAVSQLVNGVCVWCEDTKDIPLAKMVDKSGTHCPDCGTKYSHVALFTGTYFGCPKCGREAE